MRARNPKANMTRTVHPPYDTETMLRILRDDRELPRTTRVEYRGITMNGIKTVADLPDILGYRRLNFSRVGTSG